MNETIGDFETLYESHLKAQHGVIWKDSVAWYSLHGLEQTLKLSQEIVNGTYKAKPPITFTIYKPKQREIISIHYRDRVYQKPLNDLYLYPIMTRSFVKENGACQKGRGIDYERNEIFKKQLRKYYINNGSNGYVLQIDLKQYYKSLDHELVNQMFKAKLPEDIYELTKEVLENQYPGNVGYNPGSQMVQIAGISYLNGLDHFIKEKLHVKYYSRYMDDLVLISQSKKFLEHCRTEIEKELIAKKLTMHPTKTKITKLPDGITYLGFNWRLTETGKVIQTVKSQTVKDLKRTVNRLFKLYAKGKRSLECVQSSYTTRCSYIKKCNSYKLLTRLDAWYKERNHYYGVQRKRLDAHRKSNFNEYTGKGGAA